MRLLLITVLLSSFSLQASDFDKTENLFNVDLRSGKEGSTRTYEGNTFRTFETNIESVKKGITNFTDKCNNHFQSKRIYTNESASCKYHNEQLIESFSVSGTNFPEEFKNGETFLLGRRVYNRETYEFYDLVRIQEGQNELKQKTITISLRMLQDEEVKRYIEPKMKKDSVFDKTEAVFTLVEVSPKKTTLQYQYHAETSHWLLNKEVIVPQVFASIGKGMNDAVSAIEMESGATKRDIASK